MRHGETIENRDHIVQGHNPGRLSETGLQQAKDIAIKLKDEKIDYIYSSDLARAADTAKEIAKFHPNAPVVLVKALRERYVNTWQGKKHDEVGYSWEVQWIPGKRNGGGETMEEVYERLRKFCLELFKKHKSDTVLVVGHGYSGLLFLAALKGKSAMSAKLPAAPNNTEIIRLEINELH